MKRKASKKKVEKPEQLDLGIKEPFKNKVAKVRGKIGFAILRFEVKKFFQDPLVWATFVMSSVFVAHQIYTIYRYYDSLPKYLPVFDYFISIQSKLVTKEYLIVYPIISIVVGLFVFPLTSRFYNSEKQLTRFLLFALLLCTFSQSIILIHLIRTF